jgi:DNA polymerase III sliding clamp (beta) subunit (PCNA family)
MLKALKFVQGAVAAKDFVPELMHFRIENGTIRGYNGMLGLCCPIDLDLDVSPKAAQFIKAIQTCKDETVQLHVTPAGRLSIKSGKFKAFIECSPTEFPDVAPEGTEIALNGGMLGVLKTLAPFIAEDASKPWARGILLKGQSAFATNNICLVEHWMPSPFPIDVNIPRSAVLELVRIGEEPVRIQVTENRVTFHYSGNRWLSTQTYSAEWPDLTRILGAESQQLPMPAELWDAVESLSPFVDDLGRIYFKDGAARTCLTDGDGASIEVPGLPVVGGCFNSKQLLLLGKNIKTIDFSTYPSPCLFHGDNLRGAIVGFKS